jgi:hypothetical protein
MGQHHCKYCGAMVMAGLPHLDYATEDREVTCDNVDSILVWLITNGATVHRDLRCHGSSSPSPLAFKFMTPIAEWQDVHFGDTLCLGMGDFSVKRKET